MASAKQMEQKLQIITKKLNLTSVIVKAETPRRWIHVLVVAKEFEKMSAGVRENIIWKEFEEHFDDETILAITQCYLLTPQEYHTAFSTLKTTRTRGRT